MTQRICHLCGTPYEDNPLLREQPSHPPQKCLDILQYDYRETERKLSVFERQLARAKQEYLVNTK